MTPRQFIESLLRHHSKRHPSEEAEMAWHCEMVEIVGNPDPDILLKAYEIIREEYEERAFPLPATITKSIRRAAETISPASAPMSEELADRFRRIAASRRAPKSAAEIAKEESALAWQRAQIEKYGTWQNYHRATQRAMPAVAAPMASPVADVPDVTRPAFEKMQKNSPNRGLHMTRDGLSKITKRITGEHQEDAT